MKLRYSGYVILAAALAFVLVSCGKKDEQPAETASTAAHLPGSLWMRQPRARLAAQLNWTARRPLRTKSTWLRKHIACRNIRRPMNDQEVVAGPGGTLANVVVYISDDMSKYAFTIPSTPATIDQKGCMYLRTSSR